jgi:hypothetical protein
MVEELTEHNGHKHGHSDAGPLLNSLQNWASHSIVKTQRDMIATVYF